MGKWLLIVSYWTTNKEHFLVQKLIYKSRKVKGIIKEDEKKDQEETQDCQRSILFILDTRHSEQRSDFTKIQSPEHQRHYCHSNNTSSSLFLSRYSFFFFLPGNQTSFACNLLSHKRISIKNKHFCCLLTTGFLNSLSCSTI